ncbi:hypothetical protein CEXT_338901 [Caerostris extrusa]|uniref:Uncharacterized protein n=1 Tax=Caerostris extrusa TaxID=172846 RepID=A0AAV4XJH3_CAEEX|nr:hypothetical protein CEXT_338901 [Caerostris extrusa]
MHTDLYVKRMDPVVLFHQGSSNHDARVSDASQSGDDPHTDSKHYVVQKVAEGADSIAVRLAHPHMTCIRTQVEVREVSAEKKLKHQVIFKKNDSN